MIQLCGDVLNGHQRPMEAKILGYSLLQYVVGNRWDDMDEGSRDYVTRMVEGLLEENSRVSHVGFGVRSKCAVLMAVLMKRKGPLYVDETLKRILRGAVCGGGTAGGTTTGGGGLCSPVYQSLVCMVLKYLGDEVYLFTSDLSAEQVRDMLACVGSWLSEILCHVEKIVEGNYGVLLAGGGVGGELEAIRSGLETAAMYGEFAPASVMYTSGLIQAAGFLLSVNEDVRSVACAVLKEVGSRRQVSDENLENFKLAKKEVGQALMRRSTELLSAPNSEVRNL